MHVWAENILLILEHLGYTFDKTSIMKGFQIILEPANVQLIFGVQSPLSS